LPYVSLEGRKLDARFLKKKVALFIDRMEQELRIVEKRVLELLKAGKVMQIATSVNGAPHIFNVWFGYDSMLNLYFISRKDLPHSREIRKNPKVAGSIINPRYSVPGKPVLGMTFKGRAKELDSDESKEAYELYRKRYFKSRLSLDTFLKKTSMRKMYRITPKEYMLFDEIDFPEQPRHGIRIRRRR
jgi:uncharacterized protein YhbP (UPF0306 family)